MRAQGRHRGIRRSIRRSISRRPRYRGWIRRRNSLRRKAGLWLAAAAAVAAAVGVFTGTAEGSGDVRQARQASLLPSGDTIVVRVIGPILY